MTARSAESCATVVERSAGAQCGVDAPAATASCDLLRVDARLRFAPPA